MSFLGSNKASQGALVSVIIMTVVWETAVTASRTLRTYLGYQGNDDTSHDRPKHTEHWVLIEESTTYRHIGVSKLWTVEIKWSDKQVNNAYVWNSKMWSKERPITRTEAFDWKRSWLRTPKSPSNGLKTYQALSNVLPAYKYSHKVD